MSDFMTGMSRSTVRANGVRMNVWTGGEGPTLILLHGYPQTGQMWHKMAPALMAQFNLVIPDLRGYGDSEKTRTGFDKKTMSKEALRRISRIDMREIDNLELSNQGIHHIDLLRYLGGEVHSVYSIMKTFGFNSLMNFLVWIKFLVCPKNFWFFITENLKRVIKTYHLSKVIFYYICFILTFRTSL